MTLADGEGIMEKKARYQNYVLVSIILLVFGTTIATAQYKVPSVMPLIMGQLSMDVGTASWLMSIFTFVGIVLAIPTGALAKKFGPKPMLLAATAIMLVGSVFGAFCGSGVLLIVSRAIEGIALIFTAICGPLAVQRYVAPEKVGSATGIWAIWVCLGSVFGGTLTPSLFALTGFEGVWLIYAGAAVVAAVLIGLLIKEPGKGLAASIGKANDLAAGAAKDAADDGNGDGSGDGSGSKAAGAADGAGKADRAAKAAAKASYSSLFKPNTLLFLAGWTIFNLVLLAMLAFSPTFMQLQGMDPTLSGFVSTLPMLLAVISSPLFGALADKTGKLKLLIGLAMLVMGPCAYILLTDTGALMWIAAVLMGMVGLGAPVMFIVCFTNVIGRPELMAIAMGFFMLIQSLGQFLGTAITPVLLGADMSNWVFTGIVVLVLGLLGTGCVLLVKYNSR
jgi:MFS family permease